MTESQINVYDTKPKYVFIGSFDPPTYGHFNIVKRAVELFDEVTILVAENPDKKRRMFTIDESINLWKCYNLPQKVNIVSIDDFKKKKYNPNNIILIRSIRNEKDYREDENTVKINSYYGITKYFYFIAERGLEHISSSAIKKHVANFDFKKMMDHVHPLILTQLYKKIHSIKNIFIVVGRPASGKSTILNHLKNNYPDICYINTDDYLQEIKNKIKSQNVEEFIKRSIENEKQVDEAVADQWFAELKNSMYKAPKLKYYLVEIAWGLMESKKAYRYLGGNIIQITCEFNTNIQRNENRNTKHIIPYVFRIPDKDESKEICRTNGIDIFTVENDLNIDLNSDKLKNMCRNLHDYITMKTEL